MGGTFTDVIAFVEGVNKVFRVKVLTTPHDPSVGVIEGVRRVLKVVRKCLRSQDAVLDLVIHATTIATNTFLGQVGLKLPKTALVTTEGFRDVLEIGRQRRPELYNVFFEKPKPLVPRRLRLTVRERIGPDGRVIKPLDEESVKAAAKRLRVEGVESVAICLIHSYVNPAHELRVKNILKEELPNTYLVASHEVDPEYREFERVSTTVVNAALMPVLTRYISRLKAELESMGLRGDRFLVMKSDGGFSTADEACRVPASTIESGPAAGVVGAARLARELGIDKALSFDMGGTTAKVSTIVNGLPEVTDEFEVGGVIHRGRLIKGSGYVVRYPHIDLIEVSAGGGTIAWVDEAGHLRVGPYSAGSDPGPACYGRGGEDPTVTDANLILGRLGDSLAGGEVRLNRELAVKAFKKICDESGLGIIEAAYGVIRLANTEMGRAVKIATIERGYDPREFTLIAFGGAGPLHACELAQELGIREVIIPESPGLFSAMGLHMAGYRYEVKASVLKPLSTKNPVNLINTYRRLEHEAIESLKRQGVPEESVSIEWYADLRYSKQAYELRVRVRKSLSNESLIKELVKEFNTRHEEVYGYSLSDEVLIVNARVIASASTKGIRWGLSRACGNPLKEFRRTYFPSTGWIKTPVYSREAVPENQIIKGPAIIEEYDSTTIIPPNWLCVKDRGGNLRLRMLSDNS